MKGEDVTIVTWLGTALLLVAFTVLIMTTILARIGRLDDKLEVAEIADMRVPPVSCQEDEAIWWTGKDTLGCVHFEEVR